MTLSRQDLILKYIVESFIKTATPVGSKTLIETYKLPYSSATIRNEMAELEQRGLLEKTHTSSGRVPSSEGYRYYVRNLRDSSDVDEAIKQQLTLIIDQHNKSIEDVLKESCEILSHMTNLASIVLGPSSDSEHLASIQFIPISQNSATAVFVTDTGYVENKTFVLENNVNVDQIQKCVTMINDRLKGTQISKLGEKMESIKPLLEDLIHANYKIYRAFAEAFIKFASDRMGAFGKENLLDQPEFQADLRKFKRLLEFLDSPEKIRELTSSDSSLDVKILNDEDELGFDDVSFVTKKINLGQNQEGSITLVGPRRMDYDKIVNALEFLADKLDELYSDDDK